jgi:hypothetical protein
MITSTRLTFAWAAPVRRLFPVVAAEWLDQFSLRAGISAACEGYCAPHLDRAAHAQRSAATFQPFVELADVRRPSNSC